MTGSGSNPSPGGRVCGVRASAVAHVLLAVAAVLLLGYALHAQFRLGGPGADALFDKWVNDVIVLACSAACLLRAWAERRERLAWIALSLGMASWALGNIYYSLFLIDLSPLPIPSVADALWLGIYPFACAGVVLLVRARLESWRTSMWLDGVIAATALSAVSADVVLEMVLRSSGHASTADLATNLAYPLGDLVLLGMVLGAIALNGWRLDRTWTGLAVGLVAFTVTDSLFLIQTAEGSYQVGTIVDAGWLLAAVLVGYAAWQPLSRSSADRALNGWRFVIMPVLCGVVAIWLLAFDDRDAVNGWTKALAATTLIGVFARLALTFREYMQMVASSRRSDARRAAILDAAIDAIVTIDAGGRIVEWNPAAQQLFGYAAAEVIGQLVADTIVPPEQRAEHQAGLARSRETGDGPLIGTRVETMATRRGGGTFPVEIAITKVEAEGERLYTAHIRDATERHDAEQALRSSEQHRRELLARMLHAEEQERARIATELHDDTIQVMTAALIALDRLSLVSSMEESEHLVEVIGQTRRVLDEATTRTRRLMFELRPVILHELGVLPAIMVVAEQTARETGAHIEVLSTCGRFEPMLEELAYRTMREALANIRLHATSARTIWLGLEDRYGVVECIVRDNGPGFDSDEAALRPDAMLHLGLASMRERVRAAGGELEICSQLGSGTTVRFTVPATVRRAA
jgi:PAS domain S-box-containing protein